MKMDGLPKVIRHLIESARSIDNDWIVRAGKIDRPLFNFRTVRFRRKNLFSTLPWYKSENRSFSGNENSILSSSTSSLSRLLVLIVRLSGWRTISPLSRTVILSLFISKIILIISKLSLASIFESGSPGTVTSRSTLSDLTSDFFRPSSWAYLTRPNSRSDWSNRSAGTHSLSCFIISSPISGISRTS